MEPSELDNLYREVILDHSRNPRNLVEIDYPALAGHAVNPFCGDEAAIQIDLDGGRVARVGGSSKGCAISQASRSILTERLKGKSVDEIEALIPIFEGMMSGNGLSEEELDKLGDVSVLEGVRSFPIRIKCALLAWSALQEAIESYREGQRP